MRHHGEALRALTKDDKLVTALEEDLTSAPLSEENRALVNYALKLTRQPGGVVEQDIHQLRRAGFSDSAIHDAAAIAAYFNFVNRIASGLGVELESE